MIRKDDGKTEVAQLGAGHRRASLLISRPSGAHGHAAGEQEHDREYRTEQEQPAGWGHEDAAPMRRGGVIPGYHSEQAKQTVLWQSRPNA
jgi:hypothetical protein